MPGLGLVVGAEEAPCEDPPLDLPPEKVPLPVRPLHEAPVLLGPAGQVGQHLVHWAVGHVLVDREAGLTWRERGWSGKYQERKKKKGGGGKKRKKRGNKKKEERKRRKKKREKSLLHHPSSPTPLGLCRWSEGWWAGGLQQPEAAAEHQGGEAWEQPWPDEAEPARAGVAALPSPAQHRELGNVPGGVGRGHQEPWECRQPGLGQFKQHSTRNIKLTHFSSMTRGGCRQAAKPRSRGELQDRAASALDNCPVRLWLLSWPRVSAPDTDAGREISP